MIRCALSAFGLSALTAIATVIHYEGVSIPFFGPVIDGVISDRLEGYASRSEKIAADALAAEMKRQADAAATAAETFKMRELEAKAAAVTAQADLEKRTASYEQHLLETKRRCDLNSDDVDFILQHR